MRRISKRFWMGLLFSLSLILTIGLSHGGTPSSVVYAQTVEVIQNRALASYTLPDGTPVAPPPVSNITTVAVVPGIVPEPPVTPPEPPVTPPEPPVTPPEPPVTPPITPPQPPPPPVLQIIKTSDRSAAEPGSVAVYRLRVTNISTVVANPVTITDQLPRGMRYVPDSVQATPNPPTQVATTDSSLTLTFGALGPNESITVVYAVLMTPDAVRGDGRNTATASAPGAAPVVSTYQLTVRPGILADCGTIVGRVFVDKNFDGQQQPGEPGVPNAVIFMDDGNRILTDPDGLFSLANVLPGYRVGTLDLYSLPGYTLAPNLYRIEDNSVSRMARMTPGGLARMNFAVTPTFGEEQP